MGSSNPSSGVTLSEKALHARVTLLASTSSGRFIHAFMRCDVGSTPFAYGSVCDIEWQRLCVRTVLIKHGLPV